MHSFRLQSAVVLPAVLLAACVGPVEVGRVARLELCDPSSGACANGNGLELKFGTTPVGARAKRALRIRNTGKAPLSVLSVHSEGEDFVAGADTLSIPPEGDAAFDVSFAPRDVGARSATLVVETDAEGATRV